MRNDRGRLIAALIARLRDFQLAEEVLHEAAISAMSHWARSGLPASPQGWLLRVALRKAIDRLRGAKRDTRRAAELAVLAKDEADDTDPDMIADERLRLIFTCCHPALDPKSRVALTLRTLGGLSTSQIARAFLDTETTMGARLTRAKAKIAAAGIPYAVPGPEEWAGRLESVLVVIYLIFNEGYSAHDGSQSQRINLCDEAIYLARMLNELRGGEPEVDGLLALMLITDARSAARHDAQGVSIPISSQDRSKWQQLQIVEGTQNLDRAITKARPGPFQIKAAIAALHVQRTGSQGTDWQQIALLYESLLRMEPTPVVRLNHAVALAEAGALAAGLHALDALASLLGGYQPYHAACADLLRRAHRWAESLAAYDRAIALATSAPDAAFLGKRRAEVMIYAAIPEQHQ